MKTNKITKTKLSTTHIVWLIYVSLLLVLLPHAQWAFSQFEPDTAGGSVTSWLLAISFELSVGVLTHKFANQISSVKVRRRKTTDATGRTERILNWLEVTGKRYVNLYSVGLLVMTYVSATANVLHAKAYAADGYGDPIFIFTFGGILSFVSLLFAQVLSNVADEATQPDENETVIATMKRAATKANRELARLQKQNSELTVDLGKMQTVYEAWRGMNQRAQVAAQYNVGQFENLEKAAKVLGVSQSTVSRLANSVNGVEK